METINAVTEWKASLFDRTNEMRDWLSNIDAHHAQIKKLQTVAVNIPLCLKDEFYLSSDGTEMILPMPCGVAFRKAGIQGHRWTVVAYVRELASLGIWRVRQLTSGRLQSEAIVISLDVEADKRRATQAQGGYVRVNTSPPRVAAKRPSRANCKVNGQLSTCADRLLYKKIPSLPTQLLLLAFPEDGIKVSEMAVILNISRPATHTRLKVLAFHGLASKMGTRYYPLLPPVPSLTRYQQAVDSNAGQIKAARGELISIHARFMIEAARMLRSTNPPQRQLDQVRRGEARTRRLIALIDSGVPLSRLQWSV